MKYKTLDEWLDWQSTLHPNEIELGLDRVNQVWQKLHPKDLSCLVITVAGTNGKGSCIAFLDGILTAAGYRVGCYTSPHIVKYNERIKIDGVEASDDQLCDAFGQVDAARDACALTYFEFGTLAALHLFSQSHLDVILLEVGLGGRLDAVNIIDPDVAVITTIDLDHTDWLGNTREEIGAEKAGIMRSGVPMVFGDTDMPSSVHEYADKLGSPIYITGRDFGFKRQENAWDWQSNTRARNALPFPYLRGGFQLKNAATSLMVLELLNERLPIDQRAVRIGLQDASLLGRFQMTGRDPVIILDVGHNVQAMETLSENLGDLFCSGRTHAIFAMLSDKLVRESIDVIKKRVDDWYVAEVPTPRSETPAKLEQYLIEAGVERESVSRFANIKAAFEAAKNSATEEDRILVFGSFYTVAAVTELL